MERFDIDGPPATKQEALMLCAHHLALANGYFEVIDENVTPEQFVNACMVTNISLGILATRLWYEEMFRVYKS